MFCDLLSNRVIIGALIFVVLVVAGMQLYSLHVRRTGEAEVARTAREVQHLTNDKETRPQQDVDILTGTETLEETQTPLETNDTQMLSEETEAVIDETFESLELADAFLPGDLTLENEEEFAEDVPVSPYGFGPYPEVPENFIQKLGPPVWMRENPGGFPDHVLRNVELLNRVLIKLWKEGDTNIVGGSTDENGNILPHYPNTVYLKRTKVVHKEGEPPAEIIGIRGPPGTGQFHEQIIRGDIPSHLTIIPWDDNVGIDPYTFLQLEN